MKSLSYKRSSTFSGETPGAGSATQWMCPAGLALGAKSMVALISEMVPFGLFVKSVHVMVHEAC